MALGDPAPTTLLQPLPLKSRFFTWCSFARQAPRSTHGFWQHHAAIYYQ